MKSIMQTENKCFMCGRTDWLEEHHVFGASNRKNSEKYGLKVKLCHYCHNEPPEGVHHNEANNRWLKGLAQMAFIQNFEDEDFVQIFGRNYL